MAWILKSMQSPQSYFRGLVDIQALSQTGAFLTHRSAQRLAALIRFRHVWRSQTLYLLSGGASVTGAGRP